MQPRSPEEQALEVGLLADSQGCPWRPSAHWTLPVKRYLKDGVGMLAGQEGT